MNILLIFIVSTLSFAEKKCPIPENRVTPSIEEKVNFDAKTKLYTYMYKVKNGNASLELGFLSIFVDDKPITISSPKTWHGDFTSIPNTNVPNKVDWVTVRDELKPGQTASGFSIVSYHPPGVVMYSASGDNEDAPYTGQYCPDHFQEAPEGLDEIMGATIGPVPESKNQVNGEVEFKSKQHPGNIPQIDPLDKGEVELYLKDSDKFDLASVDVTSLEFGPGKAKVKRHSFINEYCKECSAHDFRRKHKKRMLKLVFKLEDMKIRCNLDYALFLRGKVDGKNLLAAQEMKPVICEPRHFPKK